MENDSFGGYRIAKVVKEVISDVVSSRPKKTYVQGPYVNYTPKYISLKFDYLELTEKELEEVDNELALLFPRRYIRVGNRKVPHYRYVDRYTTTKSHHSKVNVRFSKSPL